MRTVTGNDRVVDHNNLVIPKATEHLNLPPANLDLSINVLATKEVSVIGDLSTEVDNEFDIAFAEASLLHPRLRMTGVDETTHESSPVPSSTGGSNSDRSASCAWSLSTTTS